MRGNNGLDILDIEDDLIMELARARQGHEKNPDNVTIKISITDKENLDLIRSIEEKGLITTGETSTNHDGGIISIKKVRTTRKGIDQWESRNGGTSFQRMLDLYRALEEEPDDEQA